MTPTLIAVSARFGVTCTLASDDEHEALRDSRD